MSVLAITVLRRTAKGVRIFFACYHELGRLATEIHGCAFDLRSGRHIVCPFDFQGQPLQLPVQLSACGEVNFYFDPPYGRNHWSMRV